MDGEKEKDVVEQKEEEKEKVEQKEEDKIWRRRENNATHFHLDTCVHLDPFFILREKERDKKI